MDKKPVWTESLDQGRAYLDDALHGLGEAQSESVEDHVTNRGVIYKFDCHRCSRQSKWTFTWGEVVAFKTKQPIVPHTKYTQQGVMFLGACPCGKVNPVIFSWSDVNRYVQHAVQAGILNPKILQVA